MPEPAEEGFLSRKHHRLLNIAGEANVFAWLMLGLELVRLVMAVGTLGQQLDYANLTLQEFILKQPLNFGSYIVDWVAILFTGITSWLLLKGVALGLRMLVETDINYREAARPAVQEAAHE